MPPHSEAEARLRAFFSLDNHSQTKLDLSNCNLTELPSLFGTLIRSLPSQAANLQLLNLAHNKLTTLPSYLRLLPNLQILFLLGNSFSSIPPVISALPSVYMLSFKNNSLSGTIQGSQLPKKISWLILTSNKITALAPDFPIAARNVRKLMLSNNELSSLPETFSDHMHALELLRLANNQFIDFPLSLFRLPSLTWLSLAGNPCTHHPVSTPAELPQKLRIPDLEAEYIVEWDNPFGSGASGTAYPGIHRTSGVQVAVKTFKALSGSDGTALDEIAVTLAAGSVEGVVHAVGFCAQENKDGKIEELKLLTEKVMGGAKCIAGPPSFESCTRSVYDEGKVLTREMAEKIVRVVEKAVFGLLGVGVAHGDVYGHNVMVGMGGEVVLGDLGAAWFVPEDVRDGVRKIEKRAVEVFREEIMGMAKVSA